MAAHKPVAPTPAPAPAASTGATGTHAALQQPGARTSGANVVILSADPILIDLLRDAVAGHHRVWRADDATHAADLMVASGNAVLLIDAALADHDTKTLVTQVHQQFPDLAIIVAGRRDDEHELAPLVSEGVIFRFLHKPASAERIRNFVDATQRRANGTDLTATLPPRHKNALFGGTAELPALVPAVQAEPRRRLRAALGTPEPPAHPGRADRLGHRWPGSRGTGPPPTMRPRPPRRSRRRTPPRTRACRRCWTPPGSRSRRAP